MRKVSMHGSMAGREGGSAFFEPWQELGVAIVQRAADDYINVIRKLWKPGQTVEKKRALLKEKVGLEGFFYSEWYAFLCDVPPEKILRGCQMKARRLEEEVIARKNTHEVRKRMKKAV